MTTSDLLLPAAASAAGAWAGRGLNGLALRLAQAEGFTTSRYYPLADGSVLADIPIVGFFVRARGSRCRRLLVMESFGAAALGVAFVLLPFAHALAAGVFLLALTGASFVDLDHMVIPDLFSVGLAGLGLALSGLVPALHGCGDFGLWHGLRSVAAGLLGLAIGSSLLLWFALWGESVLGREVLGFGDVKFLGAIGAFCGWRGAVFAVFGGAVLGAGLLVLGGLARLVSVSSALPAGRAHPVSMKAGRAGWGRPFPFGPLLAAAAALYLLALHPIVDRGLDRYLVLF